MAVAHDVDAPSSRTLTILGCGTLGTAILRGLLTSSADDALLAEPLHHPISHGHRNGNKGAMLNGRASASIDKNGLKKPTHFFACVQTSQSVDRLTEQLAELHHTTPVTVVRGENVRAVHAADTILLGCQPHELDTCIGDPSMIKALKGKLLISILAGVTIPQIEAILQSSKPTLAASESNGFQPQPSPTTTIIIRAMPNTASFVHASTTVITSAPTATPEAIRLVNWLFTSIGSVTHIPASQFDLCTALCGSTPAFFALFLEALCDSAVALGLKRSEAQRMAAETMKGSAMLVLSGEAPEKVRELVATPGGSTIQGLLELERKALRGTVADALIRCTAAAGGLGEKKT